MGPCAYGTCDPLRFFAKIGSACTKHRARLTKAALHVYEHSHSPATLRAAWHSSSCAAAAQVDQAARRLSLHKRTHVGEGEVLTVEWAPDLQSIAVLCECGSPEKRESKIYVIALGSSTMHSLEVQLRGFEMAALAWTADSRRILCCGPDQKLVRSCH